MPLDFSIISSTSTVDTVTNPRELFSVIPDKDPRYRYVRDVQAEVLDAWYARRDTKDLRLKMNTGGGKTLVGLLILKSCLNEQNGPAVYVAPTPYLASQVMIEANALRIAVDDDPRSVAVARGKSILVTSIYVLLNGLSKFGLEGSGSQIPIGSIILDDAHACLATAEQQFTLTLDSALLPAAYKGILDLFLNDLRAQSLTSALDVSQAVLNRYMRVPFWAWLDKLDAVGTLLHEVRDADSIKFTWPLLRNSLQQCRCVIGEGTIEISPRCLPVSEIPSFARAKRRLFMSATFADDSVLITHFNADPASIAVAIAPNSASDIGDRMILVPQELDPSITDDDIKALAVEKAAHHNVVVIVPSGYRAKYWADVAASTLTAENLEKGVNVLRQRHLGIVVMVNKYDGIDLPQDACRVLIIDGLPNATRAIDELEQRGILHGTSIDIGNSIQQLEQGMGRGVRASDDFCVVLLMGRSLTGHLFTQQGLARLTPATRAQFELSEKAGNQVRNQGIRSIGEVMDYCLKRESNWVKAAKSALVHVKYITDSSDLAVAVARRGAWEAVSLNDLPTAEKILQDVVNATGEAAVKGWLMAELAEVIHPLNPVEAQQILRSAVKLNHLLVRPLDGIDYRRIEPLAEEQGLASHTYLKGTFKYPNQLIVAANALAEQIAFMPKSYRRFHAALRDAARMLGFRAQLPELEFGAGPDVLWSVGGLNYFVIECKNEATTDKINKSDCNQLGGSINWFLSKYDATCRATPIMVHPSPCFEHAASLPTGSRIMTATKLPQLVNAFTAYCTAAARHPNFGDSKQLSELLASYRLLPTMLLETYTESPKK